MEELALTEPVVIPGITKSKFRIVSTTFGVEGGPDDPPAIVMINLRDNNNIPHSHAYTGQEAADFIKFVNTGNFTTKSLNKRILEKLSTDGVLPGTVTGAPEA
jgi:hypothetical protein